MAELRSVGDDPTLFNATLRYLTEQRLLTLSGEAADAELEATQYGGLLPQGLPIRRGFVGYTVQQYVSRASGGDVRRVQAYDRHRDEIPVHAQSLVELSPYEGDALELGTVPNMFSMVPLAQSVHAPIMSLTSDDGLRWEADSASAAACSTTVTSTRA